MDKHRTERPLPWVFTEFFMKGKLNKRKEEEDGLNTHTHTHCVWTNDLHFWWMAACRTWHWMWPQLEHPAHYRVCMWCFYEWSPAVGEGWLQSLLQLFLLRHYHRLLHQCTLTQSGFFFLMTNLVSLLFSPLLMSPWFLAFPHTSAWVISSCACSVCHTLGASHQAISASV